jgi:hypothetical protein
LTLGDLEELGVIGSGSSGVAKKVRRITGAKGNMLHAMHSHKSCLHTRQAHHKCDQYAKKETAN